MKDYEDLEVLKKEAEVIRAELETLKSKLSDASEKDKPKLERKIKVK